MSPFEALGGENVWRMTCEDVELAIRETPKYNATCGKSNIRIQSSPRKRIIPCLPDAGVLLSYRGFNERRRIKDERSLILPSLRQPPRSALHAGPGRGVFGAGFVGQSP